MLLISLSPLRFKKCLGGLSACGGLISVCCFAQTMFFAVNSTPYDHQMTRVYPLLAVGPQVSSTPISGMAINQWMSSLREIPYRYSKEWKTPEEIGFEQTADCKGKALILFGRMRALGARNVRFVIGKRRLDSVQTHAWVEWDTRSGTLVLDPTFNWTMAPEVQDGSQYIPLFAYDGIHKYQAVNSAFAAHAPVLHSVVAPAQGVSSSHKRRARLRN
jgi:hypothetical protein